MKKRLFLLATLFALLSISVFGQSGKKFYKAGNEFVDNLKYEDAVAQFTSAIGAEPSNADYYSARANANEMLNKYAEAYSDYEKALVFKPKEVDAMVSLGRVCNKMGKFDEALVLLNHASSLDKRNSKVYPEKVTTLIGLRRFDQALKVSDTAVLIKDEPIDYYYRGIIYVSLNNDILGKKELEKAISKDKKLIEPRLELAELLIRTGDIEEAMNQINYVLSVNDKNADAYIARSEIYKKNLDYPSAINDVSKTILIDPKNPKYYLIRGKDYQEFNQHGNAINDFSKYISIDDKNPEAYFARAESYKQIRDIEKAMDDYNKITVLSEDDPIARKLLRQAKAELYNLNRENVAPEINIISPVINDNVIQLKGTSNSITIAGKILEKSSLDTLLINNEKITFSAKKNGAFEFIANVDIPAGADKVTILARDEYNNEKVLDLKVMRTETNAPKVSIVAPYTSEDGQVLLEEIKPNLYIEGKVEDESPIRSIEIGGGYTANYKKDQMNPTFSATFEIANINKFTVIAEDIYGNRDTTEFKLNRDNALLALNNPMGKTWIVFIENSSYKNFASLDGAIKDVSNIQRALANYQINNTIHKKDMTKTEMERFFNIELRDQLKANQVKSLLIWYAGHGKFINDVGYWIPVDAGRDDEFTYFNINALKAGMQSYASLTHTLVISDACESGPSFYSAMRSANDAPTCDDTKASSSKSAQVFSSAGYELAVDNSQFSQTFAQKLSANENACIPIETIVKDVSAAVSNNNQQKPKFGNISGLQFDPAGTFFFIKK
jgi:tetratricopeptide (TPR) repeat protein